MRGPSRPFLTTVRSGRAQVVLQAVRYQGAGPLAARLQFGQAQAGGASTPAAAHTQTPGSLKLQLLFGDCAVARGPWHWPVHNPLLLCLLREAVSKAARSPPWDTRLRLLVCVSLSLDDKVGKYFPI